MVPGGFSAQRHRGRAGGPAPAAGEALQEGRDGRRRSWRSSCRNIRIADQRIGDIKAQVAALTIGEKRLTALLDRYGDGDRRPRRSPSCAGAPSGRCARKIADDPRRRLRGRGLRRLATAWSTSRCTISDADHQDEGDGPRTFDMTGSSAAVPRADEQRHRHHQVGDLPRGQARLPRRADQRRHLRAAAHRRARRHVPLRALSAAGLGLRRRGEPAHRRGGVRGAGPGDPRPAVRARRPAPAATSASAATIPKEPRTTSCTSSPAAATAAARTATASPTAARRSASRRRRRSRCWSSSTRSCSRSTRCARARAAPASTAAASASTTRSGCAAARRASRW